MRAREQTPAALLDLLMAADALRRPERLDTLIEACECDALSLPGRSGDYAPAQFLRDALAIVKGVDAAAVARRSGGREGWNSNGGRCNPEGVRAARLKALRAWRKTQVDARA